MTELLYLRDAYATNFSSVVTAVRDQAVALDATLFYPTGGGQPHDTGTLAGLAVVDVRKEGADVWHTVEGGPLPEVGATVEGEIDWSRRHQLMRTHTALHVLCGVIWNEWRVPVTGTTYWHPRREERSGSFRSYPADGAGPWRCRRLVDGGVTERVDVRM